MNFTTLIRQTALILFYLFLSWILIHFLALFGFFLALALPLLHIFFYPHILCFWCQLTHSPHRFRHSLINSTLIFLITLISLPLVFLEYRLLSSFISLSVPTTARFVIPTRNQYKVGEIFPVKIELTNIPASINMAQADLSFDPTLLEVVDLDTTNTFVKFFVQQETNNDQGYLRLTGGVPNPGYQQPNGILGTSYFRTKQPGATQIRYLDSSLVLANDGKGTNLLSDFPAINLLIVADNPPASTLPTNLKLRSQIEGDSDTKVLSFANYAEALPAPFVNTLGTATESATSPTPLPTPRLSPALRALHQFDQFVISLWQRLISRISS